ncbi:ribosome maturation factor RimM [Natranaerobius trueperi]|uniref:Ribosome maturation factor RimM n=1 Tax=Natranaerobius trueperi TaxID=759412 RepID=A0A226BZ48_9FIRM|nr:ribosome maturation factor RimM [Natranaerobius trueperi]OWZ84205.1 hypothetical protein CDO51_04865 [Natranaerobius trueperi]
MNPTHDLISVGQIVGTHGVKGQVKVISLTDIRDRFNQLDRVYLVGEELETFKAHIESSFLHKNKEIVKFKEWNNINDVEQFKNFYIKIPRNERPQLPEGEFYYDQIKGLNVITVDDTPLGTITEIFQTGGNDVYEVSDDDNQVLIPAIQQVVKDVDLHAGIIVVDLPEGLLEEE